MLLTIAIVGIVAYLRSKVTKAPSNNQTQSTTTEQPQAPQSQKRAGTYEDYDPSKFVLAQDGKVVLFFMAKWSKTSKTLDASLSSKDAGIPNNLTILKVDYDKNYALRKKYEVPFENTFVQVDASGNIVNRWSGSEEPTEIYALAK